MNMNDLISRSAVLELCGSLIGNSLRSQIEALPTIIPEVFVDVTGGVLDAICSTHRVGINVLDYDITDNEQDDYRIDDDGDQVWCYGDWPKVDPEMAERMSNWPTVADQDNACDHCGEDNTGGDGYDGLCGNCADVEHGDA